MNDVVAAMVDGRLMVKIEIDVSGIPIRALDKKGLLQLLPPTCVNQIVVAH